MGCDNSPIFKPHVHGNGQVQIRGEHGGVTTINRSVTVVTPSVVLEEVRGMSIGGCGHFNRACNQVYLKFRVFFKAQTFHLEITAMNTR